MDVLPFFIALWAYIHSFILFLLYQIKTKITNEMNVK